MRTYVKTGLPGYGPDLDENDIGHDPDDIRAICDDIRHELDVLASMVLEEAALYAEQDDYQRAYESRVKVDELDTLSMTLDYERRQHAPLYKDDPTALDDTLRRIVAEAFPLDVNDQIRLYVWDAEDDEDDDDLADLLSGNPWD